MAEHMQSNDLQPSRRYLTRGSQIKKNPPPGPQDISSEEAILENNRNNENASKRTTSPDDESTEIANIWTFQQVLSHIDETINSSLKKDGTITKKILEDLYMLKCYCQNMLKEGKPSRITVSEMVAETFHPSSKGTNLARRIRTVFTYYRNHHCLPPEKRGGKRDGMSLLDNKVVFDACKEWVEMERGNGSEITIKRFCEVVNDVLFPRLGIELPVEQRIASKTCGRWLSRLGYNRTVVEKE